MFRFGSILFLSLCFLSIKMHGQVTFTKDTLLMGSAFVFTAVAENENKAKNAVQVGIDEVIRIERLISSWQNTSQTSLINSNAGISPIKVDQELVELIQRANKIAQLSNGNFDISFASLDKIWVFNQKEIEELPTNENIQSSVSKINYEDIEINLEESTVFLKQKGMKIGFGAIGKGYAADKAKSAMIKQGIESGVVNAGGDLITWGKKTNNDPWTIGISNPSDQNKMLMWLDITDMAVVTSGNYEKYFLYEGKKYCHIINPLNGWPVSGTKSVTIVSSSAEFSDALATTVFILGNKDGMKLINHLQGVEGIIIDTEDEVYYSQNIQTNIIDKS